MGTCPRCGKEKPLSELQPHTCGYEEDVHDDHEFTEVCCEDCEQEHCDDI